jgi:hypothetical protein
MIFHDIVSGGENMARGRSDQNAGILEYALHHLERERDEIEAKIAHIRRQLGGRSASASASAAGPSAASASGASSPVRKRVLSDSARKRIAAAQKRRWAEHRKAKANANANANAA